LKNLVADGRKVISNDFLRKKIGGMDRIDLAEDRKRWRAAAQNVMNFQVSQIAGSF
jgi:hypothetical protein